MSNNTQSFIDKLAPIAIKHGSKNNILPSLIIAQGCLESSFGQSELAVNANNLFGIKKGSGWNGEIYAKKTSEQKSDGTVYYIVAEFRKYPSYEGCVESLCYKYTHGTGWENFNRYQNVVGERNYKKATKALIEAGYATDIKYAEKLKRVIEQYGLTKYDKGGENMGKLIALSDGHGINTAGKRTPTLPNGQKSEVGRSYMNENLFNRAVVKYLDEELKRCGFRTLLVAPTDEDTPLEVRTNLANKHNVDLYLSVHANANTSQWGNWGGIETFTWSTGEGRRIGKIIHAELIKGSPLRDRGVKDGNHLWEIRKPNASSVLVECGFMDSHTDYKYLLSDAYRRECAREIAIGICKAYGVKYVEKENKPTQSNKGGIRMLDITSPALKKLALQTIEDMTNPNKYENPLSKVWLDKAKSGQLPLDDAVGLLLTEINMKKK